MLFRSPSCIGASPIQDGSAKSLLYDTIPDKGVIKVKLFKDSTTYDETVLFFNHKASTAYLFGEDAIYLKGFGQLSLSSISSEGNNLAINYLPYVPDMRVGLDVRTTQGGTLNLKVSYRKNIPASIQIWLKDGYQKDSLDLAKGNYSFQVNPKDTDSFGGKRFSLVLKGGH